MSVTAWSAGPGQQPPVGIDLGTTYSLVAYLDATGRPVTIPNSSGDLLTPSAVLVDEDDVIVGKEAVKSAALSPDNYVECFKRDVGSASFHRKLKGLDVPPEILSAFVLERLKKDAERRIGPVTKAVITVPAFFDEGRRRATQEAGRLAGLEVLDIINEPTAAAVAYGYGRGFFDPARAPSAAWKERVVVYDLGGGTFDVTILEIEGARFRALATDGDVRLGGKDFDERLVHHLAEKFREAHGVDPRSDPQDAAQLWLDAQEAKHALSARNRTTVVCFHAGIRMRIDVTREEFAEMIRDLVERTETTTSLTIRQLGLEWSEIDRVLLVGGSSRVSAVADMLRRVTGKEPDCSQSPDEAVAHGAALYAGMLMAQGAAAGSGDPRPAPAGEPRPARGEPRPAGPSCELVNVNSHSLGVVGIHPKTKLRTNITLIPRNTSLPARAVRVFTTARQNQRSVCVPVVEGESERPEDCIALGQCIVRDLPSGLPQGTPIEVEYRYAANGRISVSARIPTVRYSAQVEIQRDEAPELDDLPTWRSRLLGRAPGPTQASVGSPPPFAASPPPLPDAAVVDRPTLLKRLDALYGRVGQLAAGLLVPPPLTRSQQAARTAAAELTQFQAKLKEAERARQSVSAGVEAIRLDAALSQARDESQQAETRCQFACLVFGRECAAAGFTPPGAEREIQEIQQHQARLKS
jgi:molecular chaperone DnaK